ncbi:MAG: KilA-N domain-containing protein [Ignavibacteria bacterium]
MTTIKSITVQGTNIVFFDKDNQEYISLTDIARFKNPSEPKDVVKNWMRNRNTLEFIGIWEELNNPVFKGNEFVTFLHSA